jgi:acyl-CoA synthetase (AMP-forming)/AMP-acid ligase II
MTSGSGHSSLASLLARCADRQPDEVAFTFLRDGETPSDTLTWSALDARARVIARALGDIVRTGDRVLLAYPSGLDFVPAFFGCLYASTIAVPVPAPRFAKESSAIARFDAILRNARPAAVLTDSRSPPSRLKRSYCLTRRAI